MNAELSSSSYWRRLRRNLLRIGSRSSSFSGGVNGLGTVLAFLAFVAVSLGAASAVLASVVYEHRDSVGRERSPVIADVQGSPDALLWNNTGRYVGEQQVSVSVFESNSPNPPIPPGVSELPDPGEALVSPALRDLLAGHGMPDRFGRDAGLIEPEGLASATELIAYVGADTLSDGDADPVSAFGVGDDQPYVPVGKEIYDRDVQEFWAMAGFLCVLPGLIALGSAARIADDETRRRHRLLVRFGANPRQRKLIAAPRTLVTGGISLVLCFGLLILCSAVDVTVPFTNYVLEARVVRPAAGWLAAVILCAHLLAGIALNAMTAGRLGQVDKLEASQLTVPADQPAWRRTACLIAVLAVQPWVVLLADNRTLVALSTLAAAVVAVICLPAALATLMQFAGRRRGSVELGRRDVGAFLGWRITGYRSRALARLIGTVTSLVIVVGHAVVVLTLFVGPDPDQYRASERIGTSALVAEAADERAADVVRFARSRNVAALGIQLEPAQNQSVVIGECGDLSVVGVECTEGPRARDEMSSRLTEILSWRGSVDDVEIRIGSPENNNGADTFLSVVLLSRDGEDLDDVALGRDVEDAVGPGVSVQRLGASVLGGALDLRDKSQWIYVFGIPGILTLLIVGALTWAAVVVEESKALVRNPLVVGRRDVLDAIAKVRLALPIALGGVGGVAATAWLLAPHVGTDTVDLPISFLSGAVIATLVISALGWWVARRVLMSASRDQWS